MSRLIFWILLELIPRAWRLGAAWSPHLRLYILLGILKQSPLDPQVLFRLVLLSSPQRKIEHLKIREALLSEVSILILLLPVLDPVKVRLGLEIQAEAISPQKALLPCPSQKHWSNPLKSVEVAPHHLALEADLKPVQLQMAENHLEAIL